MNILSKLVLCRLYSELKDTGSSFVSLEGQEPPHIHVEAAEKFAKFWLEPISLGKSYGFRSGELTEVQRIIEGNLDLFLEKWHEHFGN